MALRRRIRVGKRELMSSRFQIAVLRVWAAIGVAAVGLGCASFETVRLYQTGTYTLDRGESGRAVAFPGHLISPFASDPRP